MIIIIRIMILPAVSFDESITDDMYTLIGRFLRTPLYLNDDDALDDIAKIYVFILTFQIIRFSSFLCNPKFEYMSRRRHSGNIYNWPSALKLGLWKKYIIILD
jgi:hypothetical protein